MAQNLKLLLKRNNRIITNIELSCLKRLRVRTNEIKTLAKKIMKKDMIVKRNEKNVTRILKNRLRDAINEESKARKEYEKNREILKTTIKCRSAEDRIMLKMYKSLKKTTSEEKFEWMMKKMI